ncbi:hypothetical protein SLE2022_245350 [Rubroshorea leprosula]
MGTWGCRVPVPETIPPVRFSGSGFCKNYAYALGFLQFLRRFLCLLQFQSSHQNPSCLDLLPFSLIEDVRSSAMTSKIC